HLSNERAAEVIGDLAREGLQQAVLAHLSDRTNRPDLAEGVCRAVLNALGVRHFMTTVAEQDRPSEIFVI
ncbi:MAG: MBL fold metallo-hydrolase, partial [bacterium]|nr:MBL fold metallo-hydrolase [bacterium]